MRIAIGGGVYSNPYALSAFCKDAARRGADRLYCLGDLGGYGAEPEAVWPLLLGNDITCIAGNYDAAIAAGGADCGCGYRDPRDQQYAQLMYDYTRAHTSAAFAAWMGDLPTEHRETVAGHGVHLVHGSPLGLNDFWWESLPADEHRRKVAHSGADVIVCTHSGMPWIRRVDGSLVVNVGVLGRPPNDGKLTVSYALLDLTRQDVDAEIVRLGYDWGSQVASMRAAGLPEAFVHTNDAGWWATCLEILPVPERARGRYHVYDSSVAAVSAAAGVTEQWPEDAPELPVRSLVGSPLLLATVWTDSSEHDRTLRESASPWTPWVPQPRSEAATKPAITGNDLRPIEPTVTDHGWYRHPAAAGTPLVDPSTGSLVRPDQPVRAYELFAEELLGQLELIDDGAAVACHVPTAAT